MDAGTIAYYDSNAERYAAATFEAVPDKARENRRRHDPSSPLLLGRLEPDDTVVQGVQKSFLGVRP